MSLQSIGKNFERHPLWFITKVGVAVIMILVTVTLLKWVFYPAKQAGRIVAKTLDADNVIYNYEWFKQMAEDLDAAALRVGITDEALSDFQKQMPSNRSEWSFGDREEESRLRTDLRGQRAYLQQMKADFRARSNMANRTIFKGDTKIIRWIDELAETTKD